MMSFTATGRPCSAPADRQILVVCRRARCGKAGGGVEVSERPHVRFERFDPIETGAHNLGGRRVASAHALDERERRFLRDLLAHGSAVCDEDDQVSRRVKRRSITQ